jgi:hypothetical protein
MGDSLSSNWRINKSQVETAEYAEVVRSLQRLLARHYPDATVTLRSENNQHDDKGRLVINPKPLADATTYPLPDESFDIMSGSVLRKSAKKETQSGDVMANFYYSERYSIPQTVARIGESQVLQRYYGGKQQKYIEKTLGYYRKELPPFEPSGHAIADALKAYVRLMIDGSPIPGLDEDTTKNLLYLIEQYEKIEELSPGDRINKYNETIDYLLEQEAQRQQAKMRQEGLHSPKGQRSSGRRGQSQKQEARERAGQEGDQALKADSEALDQLDPEDADESEISQEMEAKLQEAMEQELQDVSQLIAQLMGEDEKGEKTKGWNERRGSILARNVTQGRLRKPDAELVAALQWLRNIKNVRDLRRIRELRSGKVDARRLYKAPITDEVFRETQRKPRSKQNIWLLMDGSGSMHGYPGEHLFSMCASVKQIVSDARIYQYSGSMGVEINRVDARDGMYEVTADGGTPSGEAMLYVAYLMSKEKHQGLLVHFTDGDANSGIYLDKAVENILYKYPNVALLNVIMGSGYAPYSSYDSGNKIKSVQIRSPQEFGAILKTEVAHMWGIAV